MSKIIFSVSELNFASQRLLEESFPGIWVEGEISNLVRPTSGHYYFTLKDAKAQIRCAFFKMKARSLSFEPTNGSLVQVFAKVSLYPDRGDYQLIVEKVEMAGDGQLKKAYEALVKKLSSEGLFAEELKKPLPFLPRHIGIITSPTGAAIRDILSVLKRRFPSIPVTLFPTKVQGNEAAFEIIKALTIANQLAEVDILILARGGGSLEDLWPFNEESVARAIYASQIPIITGIGHEIDFTIADFVADRRAPTPSAAAELITPHHEAVLEKLQYYEIKIISEMNKYLQHAAQKVDWLAKHLQHPGHQIKVQLQNFVLFENRFLMMIKNVLKEKELNLKHSMKALETVSPLATLERGFAIVSTANNNQIIRSKKTLQMGDRLKMRFHDGEVEAEVTSL